MMTSLRLLIQIPGIIIVVTLLSGVFSLRDVHVLVPRYVRRGTNVRLSCNYDLGRDVLYAVKWYKGPSPYREFYRFLPKETPSSLAFNMPGINVDVTLSHDHDVTLKNVSLQSSGMYKCSVAAEFPFQTLEDATEMHVVVTGDVGPQLRLNQSEYHPGDLALAECQSPASFPAANITWYFNDVKDQGRVLKTEVRKDNSDPLAKTTMSSISFDLPEKVAPVRIYCRATVLTVYDRKSNITTIYLRPRALTGTETWFRSSGFSRASKRHHILILTFTYFTRVVLKSS